LLRRIKKIKRGIKKIWLFFKKEERKVVSMLFIFCKVILSFIIVLLTPFIYFLISISIEPRSFSQLNQYLQDQVLPKYEHIQCDLTNSKLGFNSYWNFTFNISNLSIQLPDQTDKLNLSEVLIEVDFWSLFFKKIRIDNATIINSDINLTINSAPVADANNMTVAAAEDYSKRISDAVAMLKHLKLPIRGISLKNSRIVFKNKGAEKQIKATRVNSKFYFKKKSLELKLNGVLKLNNNSRSVSLNNSCSIFENKNAFCEFEFHNLNILDTTGVLKDFIPIVNKYEKNFDADLTGKIFLSLEDYIRIKDIKYKIFSPKGSFNLREFFSQRISFNNLIVEGEGKDYLQNFAMNLSNFFDKTSFAMSLKLAGNAEISKIHMKFDAKDLPIDNLNKLWPIFLGDETGVRAWVVNHISKGIIPVAYADMDIIYDKTTGTSQIEKITSDVHILNAELNYYEKFPTIQNIDGVASFSKDNMNIKITGGNVLGSSIISGNLTADFLEDPIYLNIEAQTQGKAKDLFAHINDNKTTLNVSDLLFDGRTISEIKINLPLTDSLKFKDTYIDIKSNIESNNTNYFTNNSNIAVSIFKKLNSPNISGKIDFINSEIYLALLGFEKAKREPLRIDFNLSVTDDSVNIINIEPKDADISFKVVGQIMRENGLKTIQIKDIKYNEFDYDLYFNTVLLDNKEQDILTLTSKNFNLNALFALLKKSDNKKINLNGDVNNFVFHVNMQNLILQNNKFLKDVKAELKCENNICHSFDFIGRIDDKKVLSAGIITKNLEKPERKRLKIYSDDYGYIIDGLDISNKIINGRGNIKGELIFEKDNIIFKGTVNIPHRFNVIINNDFSTKVTDDLLRQNLLPKLRREILKKNMTFDRMKSDFKISHNKLEIREMLLRTYNVIGLGITMSGDIYLDTGKMELEGLIIPAEVINSLFGLTKLPLIGNMIDSGIFAAPYQFKKENYNKEGVLNIQKELTVLPGFTRKIPETTKKLFRKP
jgi:hypothetical protein